MEILTIPREHRSAPVTLSDYQFPLPAELIAQEPVTPRDAARLLVLDRNLTRLAHARVRELPDFLRAGDLLVFNDTRVIPARIFGRGAAGAAVEILLIRALSADSTPPGTLWLCMGKPSRRLRPGASVRFNNVDATVVDKHADGSYTLRFSDAAGLQTLIKEHGEIPLPPYIERPDGPLPFDRERYQTIFAANAGAIAAPTAGLHFTEDLVANLRRAGVELSAVTLHVGPGTFRPVRSEDPRLHVMDAEWCDIPQATVDRIERTKAGGGRVIAIGTTTTRALESSCDDTGILRAGERWADRYIRPSHDFRVVDCLFTNFHLPGSTLLMLVSALAGRDRILDAYGEAIRERYRFYSYGDAMLIL